MCVHRPLRNSFKRFAHCAQLLAVGPGTSLVESVFLDGADIGDINPMLSPGKDVQGDGGELHVQNSRAMRDIEVETAREQGEGRPWRCAERTLGKGSHLVFPENQGIKGRCHSWGRRELALLNSVQSPFPSHSL